MVETGRIILPYAPRSVFLPYHDRTQRFAVGVAHRRCGKTVACINDQIKRAILSPKERYRAAYIAPYLKQAKDVAWDYLKMYAAPLFAKPPNESELYIELLNGARLRIYGADNAEALRGGYLDDADIDEYADMNPSVWPSIIRPMLADRKGTATFIGTPKGRNAFFELYQKAQGDPNWFSFFLPASQTNILPQSELDDARKDMTPEQYEQEFECSFDAAILGAYYGKEIAQAERDGRITGVPYDEALPVYTVWDLGISSGGDTMAIWCWQMSGQDVRIIDYIGGHGQPIEHYVKILNDKPYKYESDWLPPDAKAKELIAGRTRVEEFSRLRRFPRIIENHTIADRINAGRLLFKRCWFDKVNTAEGVEGLRQYHQEFDEKSKTFRDRPAKNWASHPADSYGHMGLAWREMTIEDKPKDPIAEMLKPKTLNDVLEEYDHEHAE